MADGQELGAMLAGRVGAVACLALFFQAGSSVGVATDPLEDCVAAVAERQMTAIAGQDDEQVIVLSRQGLRDCGEHPVLYFNMAMPLVTLGRLDEGESALRRCLELDSRHAPCLKNLGNLYSDKGRYEDALRQYERMLEIDPQDDDALDNMAVVMIRQGKAGEAIDAAGRAVELRPSNVHARITRARAFLAAGRWREAIDAIDDAVYTNACYPGVTDASNDVRREAREEVVRQARGAGKDALAHYYHARVATSGSEADRALRQAIKLDPDHPRILLEYAFRLEAREIDKILESLDKCIGIDPTFWQCLGLKGEVLDDAGRREEAQQVLEQALRIAPWVPQVHWSLGLLMARQGDLDGALAALEKGFGMSECGTSRRLAVLLCRKLGDPGRALEHARSGAIAGDEECRAIVAEMTRSMAR
jgi:tetratricopeptide (TPR) repeat protein